MAGWRGGGVEIEDEIEAEVEAGVKVEVRG